MRVLIFGALGRWSIVNAFVRKDMNHTVVGPNGETLCHLPDEYPAYAIKTHGLFGSHDEPLVIVRDNSMSPLKVDATKIVDVKLDPELWDRTVMKGVMTAHFRLQRPPDMRKYLPYVILVVVVAIAAIIAIFALKGG